MWAAGADESEEHWKKNCWGGRRATSRQQPLRLVAFPVCLSCGCCAARDFWSPQSSDRGSLCYWRFSCSYYSCMGLLIQGGKAKRLSKVHHEQESWGNIIPVPNVLITKTCAFVLSPALGTDFWGQHLADGATCMSSFLASSGKAVQREEPAGLWVHEK